MWRDALHGSFGVIAEMHRRTIFSQITFSLLPLSSAALLFPRQPTWKSNLAGSGMTRQSGLPLYVSVYSAWKSKDSEATRIQ